MANVKTFPARRRMWIGGRMAEVLFTIEIDLDKIPDHLFQKAAKNKSGMTKLAHGAIRIIFSDLK